MITEEELFASIRTQVDKEFPFVVYRKPGEKSVKLICQTSAESYSGEDLDTPGFVFAAFDSLNRSLLIPIAKAEVFNCIYENRPVSQPVPPQPEQPMPARNSQDQIKHEKLVQSGIDQIKTSSIDKIVLARAEKVKVHDPDPIPIFRRLLDRYEDAFVYFWYHPETGTWMGATPETLLHSERNRFKTMALAGTQVYEEGSEITWRQKEIEEQAIVTSYIDKELQKISEVKELKIGEPYNVRAGNLLHIRTDIQGSFDSSSALSRIVTALHPTPAICGIPKAEALQFILQNEEMDREYYSGYLGEVQLSKEVKRNSNRRNQENQQFASISKVSNLYVNLRCMKLEQDIAKIFVGGGITKDSNAGEEWFETVNKSVTMRRVLVK